MRTSRNRIASTLALVGVLALGAAACEDSIEDEVGDVGEEVGDVGEEIGDEMQGEDEG